MTRLVTAATLWGWLWLMFSSAKVCHGKLLDSELQLYDRGAWSYQLSLIHCKESVADRSVSEIGNGNHREHICKLGWWKLAILLEHSATPWLYPLPLPFKLTTAPHRSPKVMILPFWLAGYKRWLPSYLPRWLYPHPKNWGFVWKACDWSSSGRIPFIWGTKRTSQGLQALT